MTTSAYKIAFLTPWRAPHRHPAFKDFPWREEEFEWQQAEYRRRGLPSFVASDGRRTAPFSVARAVNRAAAKVDADGGYTHLMILPADVGLPLNSELADALHRASGLPDSPGWAPVWSKTEYLNRPATKSVLEGRHDIREPKLHLGMTVRQCLGPTIVERELFARSGGLDERFEGWGWEDTAFRYLLASLTGPAIEPPDTAVCRALWHPSDGHRDKESDERNARLYDVVKREIDDRTGKDEPAPAEEEAEPDVAASDD